MVLVGYHILALMDYYCDWLSAVPSSSLAEQKVLGVQRDNKAEGEDTREADVMLVVLGDSSGMGDVGVAAVSFLLPTQRYQ